MRYCFRKLFVFVIVLFFALDGLHARGMINITKKAGKYADDIGHVTKTAPRIINPALSHTDDVLRIGFINADDFARLTMRRADDAARLGLRQGDDLIHNFSEIHKRTHGYKYTPKSNGKWNKTRGDSAFFPNLNHIPNPGKQKREMYSQPKTWKEIGEQNIIQVRNVAEIPQERRLLLAENYRKFSSGEIGFNFQKGEVDFSPFSYDTVDVRTIGHNRIPAERYIRDAPLNVMDVGDAVLAGKWNWSVSEARAFMQKNGLTWHERLDTYTLDMVPVDLHMVYHRGGHAVVNALVGP